VCDRLLQLCVRQLPSCVSDEYGEHSDTHREGQGSGEGQGIGASAVSVCLLTSLRLLLNVTHDNSESCHEAATLETLYFQ